MCAVIVLFAAVVTGAAAAVDHAVYLHEAPHQSEVPCSKCHTAVSTAVVRVDLGSCGVCWRCQHDFNVDTHLSLAARIWSTTFVSHHAAAHSGKSAADQQVNPQRGRIACMWGSRFLSRLRCVCTSVRLGCWLETLC
jgi:hypothetical protein